MELWVWVGDFGLVSINSECISTVAYIKLTKAPVKIHFSRNPYNLLSGEYPIFRHKQVTLYNYSDIINYLKKHNYNMDSKLSSKQVSKSYTLTNMIMASLRPLLEYTFWINNCNYKRLTSAWYYNVVIFPFNHIYSSNRRKLAYGLVENTCQCMDRIENVLQQEAEDCLLCLSYALEKNEYFFGDKPTSLDAVVFAYIVPAIKIPFPINPLLKALDSHPFLKRFIKRFNEKIFDKVEQNNKYLNYTKSGLNMKYDEDEETPMSWSSKILIMGTAVCAMVLYAMSKDIIDFSKWNYVLVSS
ncbi:hypothetical protein RN001_005166 [Aquatica leii]|uniref:Metaxin n=1 Tax=Aquatica leii TaxID=1421715 RepID=A0AAN7PBK5_9COLE|nr:hypothetical protein RN001_005166 [Aquatica leii]